MYIINDEIKSCEEVNVMYRVCKIQDIINAYTDIEEADLTKYDSSLIFTMGEFYQWAEDNVVDKIVPDDKIDEFMDSWYSVPMKFDVIIDLLM